MAFSIPTMLSVVAGVGQIMGSFSSGSSAASAGEAQANAAAYNAAVARNNAIAAEQAAAANAKQQERINSQRLSQTKANLLKNGVLMEGTPLMLIEDQAAQGELETQKILYEGQTKAQNYRNQATLDDYSGQQYRQTGQIRQSGIVNSGIFSGIGTIGSALIRN